VRYLDETVTESLLLMKDDNQNKPQGPVYKKGMAIQEAYERIKQLISINQLVPGQKLIYGDIAKKLNMGVTPVIQALNRLETSGLVRYEANKGYFVGEITEAEVRQLYQAREALEVFIIPSIIENINSKKIKEMRQRFAKRTDVRLSRRELMLDDTQFHLAIVGHAHNEVIYNLLESIFEQVYLKYRPEHLDDERIKLVLEDHREFLRLLEDGDAEGAIAWVRTHVRSSIDFVVKTIKMEKSIFDFSSDWNNYEKPHRKKSASK